MKSPLTFEQIQARRDTPLPSTDAYYLIDLEGDSNYNLLVEQGFSVLRKLSDRQYIIRKDIRKLAAHRQHFRKIYRLNHLWKLSANLLDDQNKPTGPYLLKSSQPDALASRLSALKAVQLIGKHGDFLKVDCSFEVLKQQLLPLPAILYAGKEALEPREESPVKDLNLHPNTINKIHAEFPEINGQGLTIALKELLYDLEDLDLLGKNVVNPLASETVSRHATDMATIIAGKGNTAPTGKGIAYKSRLTSSSYENLFPDSDNSFVQTNAWLQNHSYGTEPEIFYGALAEAYDRSANRNPALLHLFSAGNSGTQEALPPFEGTGMRANLTGNYKTAKNILTVGAVDTLDRPLFFSSSGPTADGRIKPELVAYSTQGTSNTTAMVSGLSALLQQAYQMHYDTLPASALLKAFLINSARDVDGEGPDYRTGFGSVDAYRAMQALKNQRFIEGSVSQGEEYTLNLTLPANARQLKVTLVWNDPAAEANSDLTLVNDLDLTLNDAEGGQTLPWVLDPQDLNRPAVRGEDHLNNVEQISLEQPAGSNFTVKVSGKDIPYGPQRFYLVYEWQQSDAFSWLSPARNDLFPYDGETDTYFRWNSTLEATTGKLEYRTAFGWELIADNIDLTKGLYRWEIPQIYAFTQARMLVNGTAYLSDTFEVSRPLRPSIGFDCGDSLLIQWSVPDSAEGYSYNLYQLEKEEMQAVRSLETNQTIVYKSDFPNSYFALQLGDSSGKAFRRGYVFDYELLSQGCYIRAFFSEALVNEGINLKADLGSNHRLEELIFERKSETGFEMLGTLSPQDKQTQQDDPEANFSGYTFLDSQPQQGLNEYRLRLIFEDGRELYSNISQNYFLEEPPVMLFPNPTTAEKGISLVAKTVESLEYHFSLYSASAQEVFRTTIQNRRDYLEFPQLKAGLYFYMIEWDDKRYYGRLVIQ